MNKRQLRQVVIILLVSLYALLGSACNDKEIRSAGNEAVNKALLSQSKLESSISNIFCDEDNVLSQCP